MSEKPSSRKISVVIPVYNGGKTICATVEHLLRQTVVPDEIIVVDDGSTDDTVAVLQMFERVVTLISQPNGGPASARNAGIRQASGDFVAFTDSDCLPDQHWLSELMKGFYAPEIAGVGGTVAGLNGGLVSEYIDLNCSLNPGFESDGEVKHLVTANACFRREALMIVKMFDERFLKPGGEDTELSIRLRRTGHRLAYVASALVLHHHKQSVLGFLKTTANYAEGHYLIEVLWPGDSWIDNPRRELFRCAIAVRSMFKRGFNLRKEYDWKRAALFSFLDHYRHVAYSWGYLRGKRKLGLSRVRVITPVETAVACRASVK